MFVSKLSPEQWAEARSLRAGGQSYAAIAARFGVQGDAIGKRARREAWPSPADGPASAAGTAKARRPSQATAGIRARLGLRLYSVIAYTVRMMELQVQKRLQACERGDAGADAPIMTKDQLDTFAAVIGQINQVTEMASEPAQTTDGRRKHANPELTRLSTDVDPDGLAAASEKDGYAREIAEHLEKLLPSS